MSKNYKIIIIVIIMLLLLNTAYQMGFYSATPLTEQEIKEAIQMCGKWGGEVVRDQDGNYMTCTTNGRLGDE